MIKAAFFDIDGTLLSHKTMQISPGTLDALKQLQKRGILCLAATGRHRNALQDLPVGDFRFDGYITLNGQLCLDGNGNRLYGCPIEGSMLEKLLKMYDAREIPMVIIEENTQYANMLTDHVVKVMTDISIPVPLVRPWSGNPIYQAVAFLAPGSEAPLEQELPHCVITRWSDGGVDIIAENGGKAAGIQGYLDTQGIDRSEIIAFGDGQNDMDMLLYAGIGVAMGNASDPVKACADFVTRSVDEEGIVYALNALNI